MNVLLKVDSGPRGNRRLWRRTPQGWLLVRGWEPLRYIKNLRRLGIYYRIVEVKA